MKNFVRIGNALVHPDYVEQFQANLVRSAQSSLDHCILTMAQHMSLRITRLITASARPLSPDDIQSCFDAEQAMIDADALRFPTVNDSIVSALDQEDIRTLLPRDMLDDYRTNYRTKVLQMILRVLPHYSPYPPDRMADQVQTAHTIGTFLRHLQEIEEKEDDKVAA